jgi:hypothetical protein
VPGQLRLAVDLSASLIRVVDGALGGPLRCGSGGTPPGALVAGRIEDVGGVAGALRQLLARAEIRETRAMIAVSDSLASFRILKFAGSATDQNVDSAASKELPSDPERMTSRWIDVQGSDDSRVVLAAVWDRGLVKRAVDAARGAGLEPTVVELKSMCVARAVQEPSCVVVDISGDPVEIFVIDDYVPQLWHSFNMTVPVGDDIGPALGSPLRQVLRYVVSRRGANFRPDAPIYLCGDQTVSGQAVAYLSQALGRPVQPMAAPPRVPETVRYGTYLTCLGMLMRRGR